MANTNILTLFHFGILYSTCYFQTYKVWFIITTKISGIIQQNMHHNIYNYFCSDLETKLDNIILGKKLIHETKLHCSINVFLHQNYFFNFDMTFSIHISKLLPIFLDHNSFMF
jgi:hypothetical protein